MTHPDCRPGRIDVIPIGPSEIRSAAEAISRGFQDNSVWKWLVPGDRARARVERRTHRGMIRHIFIPRKSGWTTATATGGALWYPPGTTRHSFRESVAEFVSFMPEGLQAVGRASRLQRQMASHWPEVPHWYLATLSIEPESQGKGHGSALIRPGLERADADGVGAWLETQDQGNVPFYRRFGFELVERIEVDAGLSLWLMWRPPSLQADRSSD